MMAKMPQLKHGNSIYNGKVSVVNKHGERGYQQIPEAAPL